MPLEPAKCAQSHSSCSGGWSGANSIYCYLLPFTIKTFRLLYRTVEKEASALPYPKTLKKLCFFIFEFRIN